MHRACGPWQALTKAVCNRPAHRITLLSLALLPFRPTLVFGLHWILLEVQRGGGGGGGGGFYLLARQGKRCLLSKRSSLLFLTV